MLGVIPFKADAFWAILPTMATCNDVFYCLCSWASAMIIIIWFDLFHLGRKGEGLWIRFPQIPSRSSHAPSFPSQNPPLTYFSNKCFWFHFSILLATAQSLTLTHSEMANQKIAGMKSLLLRAWRERWPDVQWSINVKKLLPSGGCQDNQQLAGLGKRCLSFKDNHNPFLLDFVNFSYFIIHDDIDVFYNLKFVMKRGTIIYIGGSLHNSFVIE